MAWKPLQDEAGGDLVPARVPQAGFGDVGSSRFDKKRKELKNAHF